MRKQGMRTGQKLEPLMFFSLLFEILMNNYFLVNIIYNSHPQYFVVLLRGVCSAYIFIANIEVFFDMESFFWFFNVFSTLPCRTGAVSFLNGMLQYDLKKRLSAEQLYKHKFLTKPYSQLTKINVNCEYGFVKNLCLYNCSALNL